MNGEDDDEEIGAYIYQTSHTARLFMEKAALESLLASSSTRQTQTRKSARLLTIKSNSEQDNPTTVPADASSITSNGKRKRKLVLKDKLCTTPICLKSSRKPPNKGCRYSYTGGRKRRLCSFDGGCTNIAHGGGVCRRHGAKRSTCRYEGCTNLAQVGGVCIRHGAKKYMKTCSHEGCTNNIVNGGVCRRHGATLKTCKHDGCTNIVKKGGVCRRHGAIVKHCKHKGCNNNAQIRGVCIRHGAQRYTCKHDGCINHVKKGGVCRRHGATARQCKHKGCTNQARKGGECFRHGANGL